MISLAQGYRRYGGRGLCTNCYASEKCHNRLDQWPLLNRPSSELLDDWVLLRDAGVPIERAAQRIGVTFAALDRALHRAMQNGDERGRHFGCRTIQSARQRNHLTLIK